MGQRKSHHSIMAGRMVQNKVTMISYDSFNSYIQSLEDGLFVLHIFLPKSLCCIQASAMHLGDSLSMPEGMNILRPL